MGPESSTSLKSKLAIGCDSEPIWNRTHFVVV